MAIAFVGSWTAAQFNNNTGGTLTGRTSTAGNHVEITATSTDATATFSHSQSGTILTARAFENNTADNTTIRYIENIVGGASHTISITTAAASFSALQATETSGLATSSSLDQTNKGTGNSASLLTAATATTTQADELLVGTGTITAGVVTWTPGTGYTLRGHIDDGNSGTIGFHEDQIVAATGAYTASASVANPANVWICQIATFKAAGAGGAAVVADPVRPSLDPGWLQTPWEVFQPWQGAGFDVVSTNDVPVTGLLTSGSTLVGDATHSANVAGLLASGSTLISDVSHSATTAGLLASGSSLAGPVSHDATVPGLLVSGSSLYGPVSHDATVAGLLVSGSVIGGGGVMTYFVTGLLTSGAVLYSSVSHDAALAGLLVSGSEFHATISHDAAVTGLLASGSVLYGPVSHNANVTGLLASGSVLYGPVAHNATVAGLLVSGSVLYGPIASANDVFVIGYLTSGATLYGPVSHQATVSGLLTSGSELHGPVSHTAAVTGLLTSGSVLYSDVSHRANVTGLLASGSVLYAVIGAAPVVIAPTSFILNPTNTRWRGDTDTSFLRLDLTLRFRLASMGLWFRRDDPNLNLE